MIAIVGRSGSGKTTLMNVLAGSRRPAQAGRSTSRLDVRAQLRQLG